MPLIDELNDIWEEVKRSFRDRYDESTIDLYFSPLKLVSFEKGVIHFTIDSYLKHKIICEKYLELIRDGFERFLGFAPDVSVDYVENPNKQTFPVGFRVAEQMKKQMEEEKEQERKIVEAAEFGSANLPFRFEYTFDNFIVGSSNTFAHATSLGVAENPAFLENDPVLADTLRSTYNPLFIYGPSGLGKTHLLHAVVNRIREKYPTAKILYIRGDDFTNQLIDHLSRGAMNEFKEKYRKCDVLLIDDVQFIAGKPSTQEEFFHTFNALYDEHKQIILTSDRPPREIKPLEDRLVTRFEWGLLADIQPPDLELRIAILKKKAEQIKLTISDDVLNFLAENLRSNIRQIEGAIKKLGALSFVTGSEVTMELAKGCIIELLGGEEPVNITVDKIFATVYRHFGVKKEDILSEKRNKDIANARHVVVYLIRHITDMSYPGIAKLLDKKNHTTCISSFQLIEKKIAAEPLFASEIDTILKEISEK